MKKTSNKKICCIGWIENELQKYKSLSIQAKAPEKEMERTFHPKDKW